MPRGFPERYFKCSSCTLLSINIINNNCNFIFRYISGRDSKFRLDDNIFETNSLFLIICTQFTY